MNTGQVKKQNNDLAKIVLAEIEKRALEVV